MAEPVKAILCPYCGHTQRESHRCDDCGGLFEPLSQRATQVAMGPWFIRDKRRPFRPGCSYEVLRRQIELGKVTPRTVIRGPTTRQFWTRARKAPGVAHLLGVCHSCAAKADAAAAHCPSCGAAFREPPERNELGLTYPTQAEAAAAQRALEAEVRGVTRGEASASATGDGAGDLLDEVIAGGPPSQPGDTGRALPRPQPRRVHAAPEPPRASGGAGDIEAPGGDEVFTGEPLDFTPTEDEEPARRYDGGGSSAVTWLLVALIVIAFVLLVILVVPLLQGQSA